MALSKTSSGRLPAWLRVGTWALLVGLAVTALSLAGCRTTGSEPSYYSRLSNITHYQVSTPKTTARGVRYGGALDAVALDRATAQVAACLAVMPEPTTQQKIQADCPLAALRRDVDVRAFDVFLAPDWKPSTNDPGEQVLPAAANPDLCFAPPPVGKGLKCEAPPCECNFRVAVQDNRHIVVTPNLKLYPEALVRLITACNYVWVQPLAACAAPPRLP